MKRTQSSTKYLAADAVNVIAAAAEKATQAIADAALNATKLLAQQTADATKVANTKSSFDHDLLIELKTKMDDLKTDIKELKDGTAERIATLETGKQNAKDSYVTLYKAEVEKKFDDYEGRIRGLEQRTWVWVGSLTVLTFIIPIVLKIVFKI